MNSKTFFKTLHRFYRFVLRRLKASYTAYGKPPKYPPREKLPAQTLVCDIEGGLLRSSSTFPYFMLVALEAGGFLRGLLLLALHPVISCLSREAGIRLMVAVCFCGVRKEGFRAGKAVLPMFLLEDVGAEGFEVLRRAGRKVCVTSMPTVMVEAFLRDYLEVEEVEEVVGRELKVFGGYYTGLIEEGWGLGGLVRKEEEEVEEETRVVGFGGYTVSMQQELLAHCQEVYLVSAADKQRWHPLPRRQYPKPLVFHDGRLAFKPTALSTLSMFLWLPFSLPLGLVRGLCFLLFPYSLSISLLAALGMHNRVINGNPEPEPDPSEAPPLYICNHRTLLDPLCISAALGRPVTAATYSISRIYEWLSPIRTIRLARDREEDRRQMKRLLEEGEVLVVCPEGTTCREAYLLRFSPLFAEISPSVMPVALQTRVGMFHGTSTGTYSKFFDPVFFVMNPAPCYVVEFMGRMATTARSGGSREMANYLQGEIGRRLGFECTKLTRRDKYLVLAGNEGRVEQSK